MIHVRVVFVGRAFTLTFVILIVLVVEFSRGFAYK